MALPGNLLFLSSTGSLESPREPLNALHALQFIASPRRVLGSPALRAIGSSYYSLSTIAAHRPMHDSPSNAPRALRETDRGGKAGRLASRSISTPMHSAWIM
jgi:hypothetical protein